MKGFTVLTENAYNRFQALVGGTAWARLPKATKHGLYLATYRARRNKKSQATAIAAWFNRNHPTL